MFFHPETEAEIVSLQRYLARGRKNEKRIGLTAGSAWWQRIGSQDIPVDSFRSTHCRRIRQRCRKARKDQQAEKAEAGIPEREKSILEENPNAAEKEFRRSIGEYCAAIKRHARFLTADATAHKGNRREQPFSSLSPRPHF